MTARYINLHFTLLYFAKVSVRLSYNFAFVLVSFVGFMVS